MKLKLLFLVLLLALKSFAQAPTEGLVAYYPFNGMAKDSVSNAMATVSLATLTADRFGNTNAAYNFNGNAKITMPSTNLLLNTYTHSLWVKITTLPNSNDQYMILSIGSVGTGNDGDQHLNAIRNQYPLNGYAFGCNNIGGGAYVIEQNRNLVANTWAHLVVTRTPTEARFYVNGVLMNRDDADVGTNANYGGSPTAVIGARTNMTYPFRGVIDDVRIYNRALNPAEILSLYYESNCTSPLNVSLSKSSATIEYGDETYLKATVSGGIASHIAWEVNKGNGFLPIVNDNFYRNVNSDSLLIVSTKAMNNYSYRCVAFNGLCAKRSNPINITVDSAHVVVYDTINVIKYDTLTVYDTLLVTVSDTIFYSVADTLIINTAFVSAGNTIRNTLKVYPNPVKDIVFINTGDFALMANSRIEIVSVNGQSVFNGAINTSLISINTTDFYPGYGTYLINIYDPNNVLIDSKKLVLAP